MEGFIFALLSAATFAGSQVFVRRGVSRTGESFSAVPVSISIGMLLFFLLLCFTGGWGDFWPLPWRGVVFLGLAGIIHFVVGRFLNYTSLRLIGANRGSALLRTSVFYAVAFGILFLDEPLTISLGLGVLCIAGGVTLVSFQRGAEAPKVRGKGIILALGAAFCYAITGLLIKIGMVEIGSPFTAVFISYAAAFLTIIAILLFHKGQRYDLARLNRYSLAPLALAGLSVALAQLFRYVALDYSPLSIVSPLIATSGLFVLLFSFLLNRNIEVFSVKVIVGVVATSAGAFLLF